MPKFVISPHFRLQEWVAEEKGYFKAEDLDYEFRDNYGPGDVAQKHATPNKIGAYQSIKLSFADGLLFSRLEKLIDRKVPAASLFSGPYYFLEQLGFRKVIDTTFMMATSITGDPAPEDLRRYFRALRRAQRDIDLRPELYTHYYKNEFPKRFLDQMDTRRWGPGERIVFEPYTKEVFEESFKWISERHIFAEGEMGPGKYEDSVISLAA